MFLLSIQNPWRTQTSTCIQLHLYFFFPFFGADWSLLFAAHSWHNSPQPWPRQSGYCRWLMDEWMKFTVHLHARKLTFFHKTQGFRSTSPSMLHFNRSSKPLIQNTHFHTFNHKKNTWDNYTYRYLRIHAQTAGPCFVIVPMIWDLCRLNSVSILHN